MPVKFKILPDIGYLRECFDLIDNQLFWKTRPAHHFPFGARDQTRFNKRFSGTRAGYISPSGYWEVKVDNSQYKCHRIIWKMVYEAEPPEIDHVNGNRTDNSMANLRAVTRQQNCMNKSLAKSNTSGTKGVSWHKGSSRWYASITHLGKRIFLGEFSILEDAVSARRLAEEQLFDNFRRESCEQ